MTAFGRVEKSVGPITVTMVIRTYNSRHLDMVLHLNHDYLTLEEKIKARISKVLERGRVEVRVKIKEEADAAEALVVNTDRAEAYYRALETLRAQFKIEARISLDMLTGFSDVLETRQPERNLEATWAVAKECLDETLTQLVDMRRREGAYMAEDMARRIDGIEACIRKIEALSDGLLPHYQKRLTERISRLVQGSMELDPTRIAQEAAFLADKSDISEELVRAGSHVQQFRAFLSADEPTGRKLNFLLQEFNREFNTMGSKTEKTEISHLVVEMKTELEKIREQVQNVE
jgi:uncharacterized protein (TIGR00255 family)